MYHAWSFNCRFVVYWHSNTRPTSSIFELSTVYWFCKVSHPVPVRYWLCETPMIIFPFPLKHLHKIWNLSDRVCPLMGWDRRRAQRQSTSSRHQCLVSVLAAFKYVPECSPPVLNWGVMSSQFYVHNTSISNRQECAYWLIDPVGINNYKLSQCFARLRESIFMQKMLKTGSQLQCYMQVISNVIKKSYFHSTITVTSHTFRYILTIW